VVRAWGRKAVTVLEYLLIPQSCPAWDARRSRPARRQWCFQEAGHRVPAGGARHGREEKKGQGFCVVEVQAPRARSECEPRLIGPVRPQKTDLGRGLGPRHESVSRDERRPRGAGRRSTSRRRVAGVTLRDRRRERRADAWEHKGERRRGRFGVRPSNIVRLSANVKLTDAIPKRVYQRHPRFASVGRHRRRSERARNITYKEGLVPFIANNAAGRGARLGHHRRRVEGPEAHAETDRILGAHIPRARAPVDLIDRAGDRVSFGASSLRTSRRTSHGATRRLAEAV